MICNTLHQDYTYGYKTIESDSSKWSIDWVNTGGRRRYTYIMYICARMCSGYMCAEEMSSKCAGNIITKG